ncbi:YceI family protein [Candidatus Falkowbacteria bacterium HGW-Falkowbacteria-2]|uniref:YceI family protein n=1 Tax=Candidatus Falkowbacteria bacterium HGW-Falkowbacteria-2 TaxID=2013769 RepID=A0A2N2E3Y0_9BACT|nr:MAG: YceI family protein [Candidatus Falkowbacteria bacterium HGW-Falkowbacteria-2]
MRQYLVIIILGVGLISLGACTTGRNTNYQSPDNGALPATELEGAVMPADGTYFMNTTSSVIVWHGEKLIGSAHDGTVRFNSGRLEITDGRLSSGEFIADMRTIETDDNIEMLENHLKSKDFFAVEQYPEAKLVITSVGETSEGLYRIVGDLTVKDKTNPIEFDAYLGEIDGELRAITSLMIDRTNWDVTYASNKFFKDLGDAIIKDEIQLIVDISAQR